MVKTAKQISAWSNSRLDTFETCNLRAKLAYIDKVQEVPRPPPPNGKEHANDRGSRLHTRAENFINGDEDKFCIELSNFKPELYKLREMKAKDPTSVICEGGWAFNKDWVPVPYKREDYTSWKAFKESIWARIIIDILVFKSPTEAVVIDLKSGKRFGNEIKHAKQVQLYQLAAFLRYPQLEKITTELWYLDQDELPPPQVFTRKQGLRFFPRINARALEMTTATIFEASPSEHRCKFCPYQTGGNKWITGTGDCDKNLKV